MNFKTNYIIPTSIELPWDQISPTDTNGLDYHLTVDLTIRLEDLASGNTELFVAGEMLLADGMEEKELNNVIVIEELFRREYMPAKTQERVNQYFKEGNITCFFKDSQISYLEKQFVKYGYTSSRVSVFYKGRVVDDIVELPPDEFKLIIEEFEVLNVQATIDYKDSKEEMIREYQKSYEKKVASLEKRSTQKLWNKLKGKETRNKTIVAVGTTILGVAGYIAKRVLINKGGVFGIAGALVFGTLGVLFDMYGRTELSGLMQSLFGRNDRGMFG